MAAFAIATPFASGATIVHPVEPLDVPHVQPQLPDTSSADPLQIDKAREHVTELKPEAPECSKALASESRSCGNGTRHVLYWIGGGIFLVGLVVVIRQAAREGSQPEGPRNRANGVR